MRGHPIIVEHKGTPMSLLELSEHVGIAHRTLCARYEKGDRGKTLLRPIRNKYIGMYTLFCAYCEREFQRHTKRRKYCSKTCSNKARALRDSGLARLAATGRTAQELCERLGTTRSTLRRALRRAGVYRTWQLARYRKCSGDRSAEPTRP